MNVTYIFELSMFDKFSKIMIARVFYMCNVGPSIF